MVVSGEQEGGVAVRQDLHWNTGTFATPRTGILPAGLHIGNTGTLDHPVQCEGTRTFCFCSLAQGASSGRQICQIRHVVGAPEGRGLRFDMVEGEDTQGHEGGDHRAQPDQGHGLPD